VSDKPRRTDAGRFADGTIKIVADMSAEERSMARSFRFRKKIKSWLEQNTGESWPTMGELHRDCANYAGCAAMTASRWVYQFTGPGQRWQIIELEDVFHLAKREAAARNDRKDAERLWAEEKAKEAGK
jgi:hypothetical protein